MPKSKAIVTIAIGSFHRSIWASHFATGWRRYAERFGYDLIVLDSRIDGSMLGDRRHIAWQKCLTPLHPLVSRYEHIVWVDSDVHINADTAPCLVESLSDSASFAAVIDHESEYFRRFYDLCGFAPGVSSGLNTGVIYVPKALSFMLPQVYYGYLESPGSHWENMPLSYHLVQADAVRDLDFRFNLNLPAFLQARHPELVGSDFRLRVRPDECREAVRALMSEAYFCHFIGLGDTRRLIECL